MTRLLRTGLSTGFAALMIATMGIGIRAREPQPTSKASDFAVEFKDCVESIGVTLVPTVSARAYVPQSFVLAGEGQPVTPLVVRTARCRRTGVGPKAGMS
jgi:hypothetical protein